jgi:hypothetical protein
LAVASVTLAYLVPVGSRSGSLFALLIFAAIFSVLGFLVARRLRRALQGHAPRLVAPALAGWLMFLTPVVLLYLSSLDGFYDMYTMNDGVRLAYFAPAITSDVRWADVRRIEAVPQYRGTWRLRIVTDTGTFESAAARRDIVERARTQLQNSHRAP